MTRAISYDRLRVQDNRLELTLIDLTRRFDDLAKRIDKWASGSLDFRRDLISSRHLCLSLKRNLWKFRKHYHKRWGLYAVSIDLFYFSVWISRI